MKHKESVKKFVDEKKDELINISNDIYTNPELAFEEVYASQRLSGYLKENGFKIEIPYKGLETSFNATYSHLNGDKEIVIMAEYDALPNGHSCGHNVIAASGIGAGIAAKQALIDLDIPGIIRVVGTPAEEKGGGKIILLDNGAFETSDAVLLLHPTTGVSKIAGRCKSSHVIKASYEGILSSAISRPERGVNATESTVVAYQQLGSALRYLPNDVSIMPFITSHNVNDGLLPIVSEIEVFITAFEDASLSKAKEAVERVLLGAADIVGTKIELKNEPGYLGRVVNETIGTLLHNNMTYYGEPMQEGFIDDSGFEDFGNVNRIIPGAMVYPTLLPTKKVSNHTEEFLQLANSKKSQEVVLLGSKVMAATAIDLLLDHTLIEKAKGEIVN